MDAGVANRSSEDIRALVILDMRAADEVLPSGGCTGSDSYKKKVMLDAVPYGMPWDGVVHVDVCATFCLITTIHMSAKGRCRGRRCGHAVTARLPWSYIKYLVWRETRLVLPSLACPCTTETE